MFYIGQKVVFVDDGMPNHPLGIAPQNNEIVTIHSKCWYHNGNWNISEYLYCKDGSDQSIPGRLLRPLLDDSIEYADKLIKELETEINEENLILK